jgi:acetyl-CoA C-acetyltransferase
LIRKNSAAGHHHGSPRQPEDRFQSLYGNSRVDADGNTYGTMVTRKYPQLAGKISHVHHAGNSSGVVAGAAAILLTSKSYAHSHGLKPGASIVATVNMVDCPTLMLNAPVPAAR